MIKSWIEYFGQSPAKKQIETAQGFFTYYIEEKKEHFIDVNSMSFTLNIN